MVDEEQKKLWRQEAALLKEDMDHRPKEVRKREVPIRMAQPKSTFPAALKINTRDDMDAYLRKNCGLS